MTSKIIYAYETYETTNKKGQPITVKQPLATVAYEVVSEGDGSVVVATATAICHPNDAFVKRVGRAKAAGRLNSSSHRKIYSFPSRKPLAEFSGKDWSVLEAAIRDVSVSSY